MTANIATKNWNQFRDIVSEHWHKFNNEDLDRIGAMREELVELVKQRYGYAQQRAEDEVNQFLSLADDKKETLLGNLAQKKDQVQHQLDQNLGKYDQKIHETVGYLPGNVDRLLLKYPWLSLVIALNVGLILGFWLKPRH